MNPVFIFLVFLAGFLVWCFGCFLYPKLGNLLYGRFKKIKEKMNEGEITELKTIEDEKENIEK